MKKILRMIAVSTVGGIVLLAVVYFFKWLHVSKAYDLLLNFEYVPVLGALHHFELARFAFHFGTCIVSTIVLYYIVKALHIEHRLLSYIIPITLGSAVLYFLSALTDAPPAPFDFVSWGIWVFGHLIYSIIIAYGMKFYVLHNKRKM